MTTLLTYTQDDVDALLSKMAEERGKLIVAAEGLRGDDADRVPVDAVGEEQWTAKEQLSHLWEMERGYIAWCRAGQDQSGVDAADIRGRTGGHSDPGSTGPLSTRIAGCADR